MVSASAVFLLSIKNLDGKSLACEQFSIPLPSYAPNYIVYKKSFTKLFNQKWR